MRRRSLPRDLCGRNSAQDAHPNLVRPTLPGMSGSTPDPLTVAIIEPGVAGAEAMAGVLERILNDDRPGGARAYAAVSPDRDVEELLSPAVPLEDPDTALILLTSGSTADPKGVCLSRANLLAAAVAVEKRHADVATAPRILALPATSAAGVGVLTRALIAQAPVLTLPSIAGASRFSTHMFREIVAPCLSASPVVSLVPTQLAMLMQDPDTRMMLPRLGRILLGGAPAPGNLLTAAAELNIDVCVTYGMTETCGGCVHDGYPLEGVACSVNSAGVIVIDGPMVGLGYRLRPTLTAASFTPEGFVTGDRGRFSNGRLEIIDRIDDVIQVRGNNVSLPAIDQLLLTALDTSRSVTHAVAVGVPDDVEGHQIQALVIADQSLTTDDLDQMRAIIRQHLGSAAVPRVITQVADIPVLANGKIDRLAVVRDLAPGF